MSLYFATFVLATAVVLAGLISALVRRDDRRARASDADRVRTPAAGIEKAVRGSS